MRPLPLFCWLDSLFHVPATLLMTPLMSKLQATKTKSQTSNSGWLIYVMVLLGAVIFIAPLVHIDFPKKTATIVAYEKELESEIDRIHEYLAEAREQYDSGKINAESFVRLQDGLLKELQLQEEKNTELLTSKIDSERIFGWQTPRIFLVGFGIRLPYLLFSVIISLLILKIATTDRNLSRAFLLLQILCYTITFYELVWCFWYSQDYPLETYRVAIIGMCMLLAIGATYLVRYFKTASLHHKKIIRWLMDVVVFDARKEARSDRSYTDNVLKPTIKELHERTR